MVFWGNFVVLVVFSSVFYSVMNGRGILYTEGK